MSNRARNQGPRRAPAPRERADFIRELNENDVLLGRGLGPSQYIGNIRLRELVTSRKEEYNSFNSYKVKKRIGREIYEEIVNRGGRFLQQVSNARAGARNEARDVLYEKVPKKRGEEKCKQLLRERSSDKEEQVTETETSSEMNMQAIAEEDISDSHDDSGIPPPGIAASKRRRSKSTGDDEIGFELEGIHFPQGLPPAEESSPPVSPSIPFLLSPTISEHLSPIGLPPSDRQATSVGTRNDRATLESIGFELEGIHFPEVLPSAEESSPPMSPSISSLLPPTISEHLSPLGLPPSDRQAPSVGTRNDRATLERTSVETFGEEVQEQAHSLDDDVAESFLTALGLDPNQPRFSQQDQIQERNTLTEEERRSILLDVFGDKCAITEHQSKRRHSDTDGESVSFLVKQMRTAIDMMQAHKKEAFLEALEKASPEEFSDSRLEQFLRSDGGNPELAARRFVRYWTSRRKLFGEDKYTKRMTLREAFCDDIAALEAGVFTLLPTKDLSGRHLVYIEGTRLSDVEYNPDSMVRAYWYLMEVVVQEGGSGFVVLDWLKNATLLDFDRHVFLPIISFCNSCWPIRPLPGHSCCPPKILVWLFTPIAFAMQGRELRTRNTMHDVPPDKVAESLLPFGITKEMLPMHMGGSLQLNPSDWIAKRRAIEMEEIE